MFLTPHAAVAVALTQSIDNPLVALCIGILSHFALDQVPHGDAEFGPWMKRRTDRIATLVRLVIVDLAIASVLISVLLNHVPQDSVSALSAAFGSILPDVLWGLSDLFPRISTLQSFKHFHNSLHLFPDRLSFRAGMTIQIMTLIGAVLLVIR